jgi:hypothetical protein
MNIVPHMIKFKNELTSVAMFLLENCLCQFIHSLVVNSILQLGHVLHMSFSHANQDKL